MLIPKQTDGLLAKDDETLYELYEPLACHGRCGQAPKSFLEKPEEDESENERRKASPTEERNDSARIKSQDDRSGQLLVQPGFQENALLLSEI